MNALLSATHIPLRTFALATALSLTKLALHVYIGSTLSSLATMPPPTPPAEGQTNPDVSLPISTDPENATNNHNSHGRNVKIVFMVIGMILGFAVSAYVWIVTKQEIAASEGSRIERRRKRRESLRQNRASMRSVAGVGSGREPHLYLLSRSGSSSGIVELGQDCVPVIDLTSTSSSGSDFVGGTAGFSMNGYQDDEEEGLEDQALVGGDSGDRPHRLHSLSRPGASHGVGGGVSAGLVDYGSDSDDSDFLDDDYDDDDVSDMERGIDDEAEGDRNPRSPLTSGRQNMTEMDVRNPSSRHAQGLLGSSQDGMGWFAENGVDISDHERRW